jgi:transcriptional regulator with XRE-family HTH domain
MDWVKLGTKIKAARESKDLSQKDIAKLLDVSTSLVCQLEAGKKKVSVDKLIKIGKVLGIKILE